MRVGLTGGIGSGKSEVARLLRHFGAFVIDTDELAREAVEPGSDGVRAIERMWPRVVRHGAIDRAALADIVFSDAMSREKLNSIVHPIVRQQALERESLARKGQVIVHVVPLLFETGYIDLVQQSILVTAPLEQRIWRVVHRDNTDEPRVRGRIAAQVDPEEVRARATYVIENDGDLDMLRDRTRDVYHRILVTQP